MTRKPWLKFYPQDWKGDTALHSCSLSARGAWIELMSIAHEAEPYGYVLINGSAPRISTLALLLGTGEAECESAVKELESAGVFSRSRNGVIYSRRMMRDGKRAEEGRKTKKAALFQHIESKGEKPAPSRVPTRAPTRVPSSRAYQRPEARGQKEEDISDSILESSPRKPVSGDGPKPSRSSLPAEQSSAAESRYPPFDEKPDGKRFAYPEAFAAFWGIWKPIQRATETKSAAYTAWRAALLKGATELEIHDGAIGYASHIQRSDDPVCLAQTWFNRRGWTASHAQREPASLCQGFGRHAGSGKRTLTGVAAGRAVLLEHAAERTPAVPVEPGAGMGNVVDAEWSEPGDGTAAPGTDGDPFE